MSEQWLVEREGETLPVPAGDMRASQVVAAWLSKFSASSRATYGAEAISFLRWVWGQRGEGEWPGFVPDRLLRSIDSITIAAYLEERRSRPRQFTRTYNVYERDEWGSVLRDDEGNPVTRKVVIEGTAKSPARPVRQGWILSVLRSLAKYLFAYQYMSSDEYARTKIIEVPKGESKPARKVPIEVMQTTVARTQAPEGGKIRALRDRTILVLLWDSAIRKAECQGLRVGDFQVLKVGDETKYELTIMGKGGRPRIIDWLTTGGRQLELWLEESDLAGKVDAPMFPSMEKPGPANFPRKIRRDRATGKILFLRTLDKVVARSFINAGFVKSDGKNSLYTCHGIRRGSVQQAIKIKYLETGVFDIMLGMKMLGHKSPKTTQGYIAEIAEELSAGVPVGHALLSPDVNGYTEEPQEKGGDA